MFNDLRALVGTALMERLTLLLNHVLRAEPAAVQRMLPHAGRCIRLQFAGWPGTLPALPDSAFRITPAGLFEWCGEAAAGDIEGASELGADLRISVDASNPVLGLLQALAGDRPKVTVMGDAALAADVDWLFDNLRWEVQDDLSRLVGAAPAREMGRIGRGIAAGLREAARRLGSLATAGDGTPAEPAR